jgi:hypothetical protein
VLAWSIKAWKAYAKRAGTYQTRALLAITYLLMLGPGALIARLFGTRLLDLRADSATTTWLRRGPQEKTLDALRRQF